MKQSSTKNHLALAKTNDHWKTDEWYVEWQRVTTNDSKWQGVAQRVTARDNECYSKWQRMITSDNGWQEMTASNKKWQCVTYNDSEG